ncbi:basic helix-loop-helix domain-containing protein [Aspergillus undulatus]|uniref:basic helix-loop-helix domain-containing protein n=1 Tax=Aspergillus undulatus TaxID=1810928 RepID=UPI003CCE3E1B
MAAPGMGSDFQLFSPAQSRGRKSSNGGSSDDAGQDWTEWMRWDDQAFSDTVKDLPLSPPTTSPQFSAPNNGLDFLSTTDFSPDIPIDCTNPFQPFLKPEPGTGSTQTFFNDGTDPFSSVLSGSPSSTAVGQKRKSGSDDDGSADSGVVQEVKKVPSKKRAHNVIEKRYRANLNDKIAELRDSVPSLRASKGNGKLVDDEEGVTPANKLNKASILSKATDYIKHLETRNKRLEDENTALKIRLRELEKAADQTITSAASVSSPSNYTVSTESGSSSSPSVFSNPEDSPIDQSPPSRPAVGMIKIPDSFKRMRTEQPKNDLWSQSYMQPSSSTGGATAAGNGRRRSHYPNKYVLGTLAGLMVFEGLGKEKETDSTAKGLLAVPMNYLRNVEVPPALYEVMGGSFWSTWHARAILHFLFLAVLVVGSAFIVFVYLFNSGSGRQNNSKTTVPDVMLSSSNFRRQAWLTSIQRVGVPRHRFFHEWYVVTSRCFEYVLRCILGWKLYTSITGITADDEKGRVKTWDIAIDAQLSGGDAEISKSRLVLTIFAAGTLPRSPMRMMLKALHCRILLWRVGVPGQWSYRVSNDVARSLARYQWNLARQKNAALPKDHPDALPSHLQTLLQCECEDVMIDSITQRAANLTWNRPTQEGSDGDDAFLDVVEEDPAIQSSLDALAAWFSSHLLQRALLRYFEASARGPDAKKSRDLFKSKIQLALDVAPQPSAAHTRALVMMAVFFEQDRVENIGAVLSALPKEKSKTKQNQTFNFLDSSLPVSVREEISIAVRCAMIAAIFTARSRDETSLPESFTMDKAVTWFSQLPLDPVDLTLLGFSAVYHLLHVLALDTGYLSSSDSSRPNSPALRDSSSPWNSSDDDAEDEADEPATAVRKEISPEPLPLIGRVASELMYWARNAYNPTFYGFTTDLIQIIEDECTSLCRGAGIDVADYSRLHQERLKTSHRKDRRKSKHSRPSKSEHTQAAETRRSSQHMEEQTTRPHHTVSEAAG